MRLLYFVKRRRLEQPDSLAAPQTAGCAGGVLKETRSSEAPLRLRLGENISKID